MYKPSQLNPSNHLLKNIFEFHNITKKNFFLYRKTYFILDILYSILVSYFYFKKIHLVSLHLNLLKLHLIQKMSLKIAYFKSGSLPVILYVNTENLKYICAYQNNMGVNYKLKILLSFLPCISFKFELEYILLVNGWLKI